MRRFDRLYVGGAWVAPAGEGRIEVVDSASEEGFASVPLGNGTDVARAVAAAKQAFESWSATSPSERADYLSRIASGLEERLSEIATTVAREVGMPLKMAFAIQAKLPAHVATLYAELAARYSFEETVGNSWIVKEPVGVVGCITPWNYPLHQIMLKVAAACAAGCPVVVKPSEIAPLTAFLLAEVVDEAELPPGVFNLVSGLGDVAGEALVVHDDVDKVSFTGSGRAGRRISELAAKTTKRLALELGGKSASVVLDDADLERAVTATVKNCCLNSGQTCSAWTRLLVPNALRRKAVELAKATAESFVLGPPLEEASRLGPLASAAGRDRVRSYIERGIAEGATLVAGGSAAPVGLDVGYYVMPTVFADVTPSMTIAQEEIFGPVLSILEYEGDEEAVQICNDSLYGLAGSVWSADIERAKGIARRMRTGQIDINGARFNPLAPFGGYKQSGHGREFGRYGLEEFLEIKSIQL